MQAVLFLALTVLAQDANTTLPDRVVILEARVAQLEQENADLRAQLKPKKKLPSPQQPTEADYLPTFTWPGHDGPEPFKSLASHLRVGEAVHDARDVTGWSPYKLAFTHDQDHFEEYMAEGKPLPVARDPRLAAWLKTVKKAPVRKIVMETWRSGCSWCEKWLREDKPKAERDGFTIEVVYVTTGSVPRFRICDGDRCSQYTGYIQFERLKAMVR